MTTGKRGGKRPGAGRKRLYHSPLQTVAARVDRAQLADVSARLECSESEAIRYAVDALHRYLARQEQA